MRLSAIFIAVGGVFLLTCCVTFALAWGLFAAPYGLAFLRSASSISRSMFGYIASLRFTRFQRTNASS